MRLDQDTVAYFKAIAGEIGIPYQTLINLYLRDCAIHQRKLDARTITRFKMASGQAFPPNACALYSREAGRPGRRDYVRTPTDSCHRHYTSAVPKSFSG